MDFLKAEIERKKRQIAEKNVFQPEKKYFKRGDLVAVQEREYIEKYGPKTVTIEQPEKKEETIEQESDAPVIHDDYYPLPRAEVIRRFREAFQPILLFGETDDQANLRLRTIEIVGDTDKLSAQNDYREAMKRVDQQYAKAMEKDNEGLVDEDKNVFDSKLYHSDKSIEDLLDMATELRQGDLKHDDKVIAEWIKFTITMWGNELKSKPEAERISMKVRAEAVTFSQTKAYVKPLIKLLKKHKLTDDIRDSLSSMIKYVLQRDYILANERYMEMAIGNAPWPIGVTNAGIHARPGRERIFSKHVAHVLNDEFQRKYIQGLKRLMTKSQVYFKTDPSRSMDFNKEIYEENGRADTEIKAGLTRLEEERNRKEDIPGAEMPGGSSD